MAGTPPLMSGGCFAPPLSDELLDTYQRMVEDLGPCPIKDAMQRLLECCWEWWDLPDPDETSMEINHPTGFRTRALMPEHKEILHALTPWEHETEAMKVLFDTIPANEFWHYDEKIWAKAEEQTGLKVDPSTVMEITPDVVKVSRAYRELGGFITSYRNAAHHLLWHVIEFNLEREPITTDKLPRPTK